MVTLKFEIDKLLVRRDFDWIYRLINMKLSELQAPGGCQPMYARQRETEQLRSLSSKIRVLDTTTQLAQS